MSSPIQIITADAWPAIRDALPPAEWLLEPLIPAHAKTILHGPPGSGKSAFIWGAANAIQQGLSYLGFQTRKANVLLVSPDMNLHEIKQRWGLNFLPAFDFVCIPPMDCTKPGFSGSYEALTIKRHIEGQGIELVIFDALGGIHSGRSHKDDETADDVDRVLDTWLAGLAVVLLHHDKKTRFGPEGEPMEPTDEDFLGSNKWRANATSQLHMWPQSGHMSILKHAKSQVSALHADPVKLYIDLHGRAEAWDQHRANEVMGKYAKAVSELKLSGLPLMEQDAKVAQFWGVSESTARRWRTLAKL